MERKSIAPLDTAAAPPAASLRGSNQHIARYEAAPPSASILGMDIQFDIHHAPHIDQKPPRPVCGVPICQSTTGEDTRGCFQSPTKKNVVHSNSCGLFVDAGAFEGQCELARSYTEAIKCLFECESIIGTFTERLASKEERIADLESKLVGMSFELASLKAYVDEHRSKRRSPFSCGSNDTDTTASCSNHSNTVDIHVGDNATSLRQVTSICRHSFTAAIQEPYRQEFCRWSRSLESMTWKGSSRTDDMSSDALDESVATLKGFSTNISQFFRKKMDDKSMEQVARRPPNKKRVERQSELQKSLASLEGVVFPSSYASGLSDQE
jgi:hypothetical protein